MGPKPDLHYLRCAIDDGFDLWRGFIRERKVPPQQLLSGFQSVILLLNDFLRYCVREKLAVTDDDSLTEVVVRFAELQELPKRMRGERLPVSWLFHAGSGAPQVLIDRAVMTRELVRLENMVSNLTGWERSAVAPRFFDSEKYLRARMAPIVAKLALHEIGHVVLHWNRQSPGPRDQYIKNVPHKFELHAWVFAGIIYGLAVGQLAVTGRNNHGTDTAWIRLLEESFQFS